MIQTREQTGIVVFCVILAACCSVRAQNANLQRQLESGPLEQLASETLKFGDPVRGAIAFYLPTMNCAKCHEQNQTGRNLGPDLAEKRLVTTEHLIQSIMSPSAVVREGFQSVVVQLLDGRALTGVLVQQSDDWLIIDQIQQPDKPLKIAIDEIDAWRITDKSSMPEQLVNQLADRQQFLDLVSYLREIAEGGGARAIQLKPAGIGVTVPLPDYEAHIDHRGMIADWNPAAYQRGKEIYEMRCASCHGNIDAEGTMPTSLRFASGKFKHGKDPLTMYRTLTYGFGMMNAQRWMVPQQKYDVIHYIREHFLKPANPSELFEITPEYVAGLPGGNTRGPAPEMRRPWTEMDYGPSLNNTIEVSGDGSNIAQKGIAIRLDDGPGGVESGKYWMMYDHDTLRVAGAWTGSFIDYNGIHFNGVHGRHPAIAGQVHIENPVGPGWGRPDDHSFEDHRVLGRDNKQYGPLDRKWAHYQGLYRFGKQTVIEYTVGGTNVLESPALQFVDEQPVYIRRFNIGPRDKAMVLQVARAGASQSATISDDGQIAVLMPPKKTEAHPVGEPLAKAGWELNGDRFAQTGETNIFDMHQNDYTIYAEIKTKSDGTIFSQTHDAEEWIAGGKTFFIRGGRLHLDIGWVGVVASEAQVPEDRWTRVAMTWRAADGRTEFYIDGQPAGTGYLSSKISASNTVQRIGFTNSNFPSPSFFSGEIKEVRFFQRNLTADEIRHVQDADGAKLIGHWGNMTEGKVEDHSSSGADMIVVEGAHRQALHPVGLCARVTDSAGDVSWHATQTGDLRLTIPAGDREIRFSLYQLAFDQPQDLDVLNAAMKKLPQKTDDLHALTHGGPMNWPQIIQTPWKKGTEEGPFQVDIFTRPTHNPWNARLRLTGIDFLPAENGSTDGRDAVVSAWDGSIWRVSGIDQASTAKSDTIGWQRIAAGLFQPLGVKIVDGQIYVTCRDQIVRLHDLNGDHEIDWYENFNNDHQVTEHFHEFAMGLQADDEGNFYYAKSARHALKAIVPHHGTLLKVSSDGSRTEIVANGFRAANGVCLNADGTFIVTDQEGHWNPKNRINWVSKGGFYGNMFGYHDVSDSSDEAMEQPLCWITNSFDRSPSELLWVTSNRWGPLQGSLLNFSYGYGKIYVVPHEQIGGQMQGGMCEFPLERFPTGVMRGRFHPVDGQLYCCGMFAWAGDQQQPGGLYRVRYTGNPVYLPIGLHARRDGMEITFSGMVDREAACDPSNYAIRIWDLKRTENYGSDHYNEKRLQVAQARLSDNGQTVELTIPEIKPTWCMEIVYAIKTGTGQPLKGRIHNTIHQLGD